MTQKKKQDEVKKRQKALLRRLKWKRNRIIGKTRQFINRTTPKTQFGKTAYTAIITTVCTLLVTSLWPIPSLKNKPKRPMPNKVSQTLICEDCGNIAFIKTDNGKKIDNATCIDCQIVYRDITNFGTEKQRE